jgi:hypothetical protein
VAQQVRRPLPRLHTARQYTAKQQRRHQAAWGRGSAWWLAVAAHQSGDTIQKSVNTTTTAAPSGVKWQKRFLNLLFTEAARNEYHPAVHIMQSDSCEMLDVEPGMHWLAHGLTCCGSGRHLVGTRTAQAPSNPSEGPRAPASPVDQQHQQDNDVTLQDMRRRHCSA